MPKKKGKGKGQRKHQYRCDSNRVSFTLKHLFLKLLNDLKQYIVTIMEMCALVRTMLELPNKVCIFKSRYRDLLPLQCTKNILVFLLVHKLKYNHTVIAISSSKCVAGFIPSGSRRRQ